MPSFSYMAGLLHVPIHRRQGKFFVCGSHKRTLTRILLLLVIPIFISLSYNSPVHVPDTGILSKIWIVQMQTIFTITFWENVDFVYIPIVMINSKLFFLKKIQCCICI